MGNSNEKEGKWHVCVSKMLFTFYRILGDCILELLICQAGEAGFKPTSIQPKNPSILSMIRYTISAIQFTLPNILVHTQEECILCLTLEYCICSTLQAAKFFTEDNSKCEMPINSFTFLQQVYQDLFWVMTSTDCLQIICIKKHSLSSKPMLFPILLDSHSFRTSEATEIEWVNKVGNAEGFQRE